MFCLTLEHNETCEAFLFYKNMEKETKLCKACGIEKELNEFLVRRRSEKGRHPRCKKCVKSNKYIEGCEAEKGSYKDVIGTKHTTNEGLTVTIIAGTDFKNLTVEFEDGNIVENVIFGNLKRGSLNHPNNRKVRGFNKEKERLRKNREHKVKLIKDRVETEYVNKQGSKFKIINYKNYNNINVLFEDGTVVNKTSFEKISKGLVFHGNEQVLLDVGFMGTQVYEKYYDSNHFCYRRWHNMIYRCYGEHKREKQPTYKDVTVCEEWHNFQNYANWCEKNWRSWMNDTWHLDKDIICKECKMYSPETCAFVPSEINAIFVTRVNYRGNNPIGTHKSSENRWRASISMRGIMFDLGNHKTPEEAFQAYKITKEAYIKEKAEEWKDRIDLRVYEAMVNYEVKITD